MTPNSPVCCSVSNVSCRVVQSVAECCRVLQSVAECCRVLCCSVLRYVAACCSALQFVAECCRVLQSVAERCRVLQCVAACCSVMWRGAGFGCIDCAQTHYNRFQLQHTVQHTATHLHTLQYNIMQIPRASSANDSRSKVIEFQIFA